VQINWTDAHSQALREYFAKGMSCALIARAINERFGTLYSRNAALGRAKRMGLSGAEGGGRLMPKSKQPPARLRKAGSTVPGHARSAAIFERAAALQLRCVGIAPRHLAVVELEPGDCRYPYGGDKDGEAITFCGHPRRDGSSYCTSHFHLTRGPGTASERAATRVPLRLVEAA
jgi:GcrA cell cycle regulator